MVMGWHSKFTEVVHLLLLLPLVFTQVSFQNLSNPSTFVAHQQGLSQVQGPELLKAMEVRLGSG